MNKHESFAISDFSLRDIPVFLIGYGIISVVCVLAALVIVLQIGFAGRSLSDVSEKATASVESGEVVIYVWSS